MSLELILAGIILIALTFYVLFGGADYGAGVWSLLARGPRALAQREAIAKAIGPIWEANHVWLILVVTILFTAFPKAFALMSTQLHIPLSLMLIGIVLRGSAFAFRTNDVVPRTVSEAGAQKFWERVFAVSSVFTPMMLGLTIGAVASGLKTGQAGTFMDVFVRPWATPFCFTVGLLALVLFAFLAAVYLMLEAQDDALREDFRQRALWAGGVAVLLAGTVFLLSNSAAPHVRDHLSQTTWGAMTMGLAGLSALGAFMSLWQRLYRIAFVCAVNEVIFIVWGWGVAQYPYLVIPDVTISDSAPLPTLQLVLATLLIGALLLFPSLYYLYRIFKGGTILRVLE
ncbi:MAG TPA: cytochrome d ubiquinol oxidase subunit II [Nitrospiraceae bacterium]|nr:cytochrome d ubiquinol oxidase subunit II [Nitrospiraceae bacterium]